MKSDDASAILRAAKRLLIARPSGPPAKVDARIGAANHSSKRLISLGVHPSEAAEFNDDARKKGFSAISFKQDGTCMCDDRRTEHEYMYYRYNKINREGGYFETIPDSRKRELERLRG